MSQGLALWGELDLNQAPSPDCLCPDAVTLFMFPLRVGEAAHPLPGFQMNRTALPPLPPSVRALLAHRLALALGLEAEKL